MRVAGVDPRAACRDSCPREVSGAACLCAFARAEQLCVPCFLVCHSSILRDSLDNARAQLGPQLTKASVYKWAHARQTCQKAPGAG